MKKLLGRLCLFFLPILLYFGVFITFEPYNYFGLQANNYTAQDQLIYRVRAFDAEPQNALILGDSRMAHFDLGLVEETAGRKFSTLAFGGAGQKEVIDLFWHAVEKNPAIDTVYLEVSFYILNEKYDRDRIANIETITQNPLAFLCDFNYHLEALNRLKMTLEGQYLGPENETATYTSADYTAADGTALPYRRQLLQYLHNVYPYLSADSDGLPVPLTRDLTDEELFALYEFLTNPARAESSIYKINEEQVGRLEEVAAYCKRHGIRLVFVLPPMADAMRELVCRPLGIDQAMQPVLARLAATGAEVRDYEWTNPPNLPEDLFFDGFHIDTQRGLPLYTRLLFREEP